jgi:methylornithine synthase
MSSVASISNNIVFSIVDKLASGFDLEREELKILLTLSRPEDIDYLFAAARKVRTAHFGNTVFLYGFLYFSTYCRNDCSFCQYRKTNGELRRYRKNIEEILPAADEMKHFGVHLIDLTMGEDPYLLDSNSNDSGKFFEIAQAVKKRTGLPIMLSPGVLDEAQIVELARSGMEWFACYQETYNRQLFSELRSGQSFDKRMAAKKIARNNGMLVEEGILLGAGAKPDDIVDALYFMRNEQFDQVRAMRFVESKGVTIVADKDSPENQEYLTIAVMRLLMPEVLIPATLDVDGLEGLSVRLAAGANVVTSVVPPNNGLAGVANASLDIEESRRSIEMITPILHEAGLEVASQRTYQAWIDSRRGRLPAKDPSPEVSLCA